MSYKHLIKNSVFPYHIVARSNNKAPFPIPKDSLWPIFMRLLQKTQERFHANIHSFVLMDNHFHLIISTPDENIEKIMHFLMRQSCIEINFISKRINHTWGSRYKWSLISSESYYAQVYRYVYRNPVKAGIDTDPLNYPYSTLLQEFQPLKGVIRLNNSNFIFEDFYKTSPGKRYAWVCQTPSDLVNSIVQRGIKKAFFNVAKRDALKLNNDFFDYQAGGAR